MNISAQSIRIKNLSEIPWCAPILAHWSFLEWYKNRDIAFRLNLLAYQERAKNASIPFTQVLLCNDLPLGMASVKENDLWSRKDLNPWLASVFIHAQYRQKGYGKKLIENTLARAKEQSVSRMYLFLGQTEQAKLEKFYQTIGWNFLEKSMDNDGAPTKIFFKDL